MLSFFIFPYSLINSILAVLCVWLENVIKPTKQIFKLQKLGGVGAAEHQPLCLEVKYWHCDTFNIV